MENERRELANKILIRELIASGHLKSPRIIDAFRVIDRRHFVSADYVTEAYGNYPLPIGHGQTISQPLTVAFMLEVLAPRRGDFIFEIGTGSGWVTALLAHLVGNSGKVVSTEIIPELYKRAMIHVGSYDFIRSGVVHILLSDGSHGAPAEFFPEGGFDSIISAASAQRSLPESWKRQVRIGGRIVAPIRECIAVFDRTDEERFTMKEYSGFAFVPLVERDE